MSLLKATTLVEILIVMAIFSIVALGTVNIFIVADKMWNLDMGLIELQVTARSAMERILKEVRAWDNVVIENTTFPKFTNANGTITYFVNVIDNKIIRQNATTNTTIANNANFTIYNISSDKFYNITIYTGKNIRGRIIQFNLTEAVRLRN